MRTPTRSMTTAMFTLCAASLLACSSGSGTAMTTSASSTSSGQTSVGAGTGMDDGGTVPTTAPAAANPWWPPAPERWPEMPVPSASAGTAGPSKASAGTVRPGRARSPAHRSGTRASGWRRRALASAPARPAHWARAPGPPRGPAPRRPGEERRSACPPASLDTGSTICPGPGPSSSRGQSRQATRQSTMKRLAPVAVDERWRSAPSATW